MKHRFIYVIPFIVLLGLSSCDKILRLADSDYAEQQDMKQALAFFVDENQYMTERDALSKEINYYREPNIVRQEFIGTLSGKTLIHIANEIQKEDENKPSFANMRYIRNESDIKEYGLNHPNEQVAKVYVFGGDFVNYNRGMTQIFKIIVYIPEINRFIEVDGKFIDCINSSIDINSNDYKWIWSLPNWSEKSL